MKPAVFVTEPMGGWMCTCGQRRGAHMTTVIGQPRRDGGCPGFVPAETAAEIDPHATHKRGSVADVMGACLPCGWSLIDWMCTKSEANHLGRNGRRLRTHYENSPGFEREGSISSS